MTSPLYIRIMTTKPATTRFAPSPTGRLHIGHAASALFSAEHAQGGNFLLRIEDIDQTRCKREYTDTIFDDLAWLGLTWPQPVRIQSQHMDDYASLLSILREDDLVYPCFCTRKDIEAEITQAGNAPHGFDGHVYPGTCRNISAQQRNDLIAQGVPYALRLDMHKALRRVTGPLVWHDRYKGAQTANPARHGDVVLGRKDCMASYHLCVTHDDHLQHVSLITRGEDLFEATDIHVLLQHILGYDTPEYAHHGLLLDKDGKRFAKRNHAVTLQDLRNNGVQPDQLKTALQDGSWNSLPGIAETV
jgi:glutamyl-Q tRNA(Asp) synthetase